MEQLPGHSGSPSSSTSIARPFYLFCADLHRQPSFTLTVLSGQLFHTVTSPFRFAFEDTTRLVPNYCNETLLKNVCPSAGKNLIRTQRGNSIVEWVAAKCRGTGLNLQHVKAMKTSSLDSIGPMDFSKQDQAGEPVHSGSEGK